MPTASTAAFATWTIPFWPTLLLLLTAIVYTRGWRQIRLTRAEQFPVWRLLCMLGGLATVWLAIASPLDSLSGLLLVVHMTQHLLLMSVAPPLVALSAPAVPLLRGLPRFWVREGLGPFFSLAPVHALQRLLKSRLFAWLAMNLAFVAWHIPAAYDLALAHPQLHEVEHACFFLTSLLFWWPVLEPWPIVYKGSRWLMLPYLMSADIVNTALSASLSFSGRVIYPTYANAPRIFGISAVNDQVAAGSLMWVLGSTAFLPPIMWITLRMLSRRAERQKAARAFATNSGALHTNASALSAPTLQIAHHPERSGRSAVALIEPSQKPLTQEDKGHPERSTGPAAALTEHSPKCPTQEERGHPERSEGSAVAFALPLLNRSQAPRFDLFTLPALAAFFKSRYGRQSLQAILLLAAAAILVDGLFGHQMGSMNLAGIVPWTYARALFVLALLLVGNLFCMSCPFMLPRELAKKLALTLGLARLPWPRQLRNKWLSTALLALFFWVYEAFALWDSPLRTASLLLAYFLTAIAIDSVFRGASFCKYVCPLGQFNFVSSLLSPVSLQARSQATCTSCSTRDCIAGNEHQRGCELDLFMPQKSGNLDCTLCMDCVKACPHDNIGLYLQPPAPELVQLTTWDPQRSSVGHYSHRTDVATLALLVVAAAFASAAVMVAPVASLLNRASATLPAWLAPSAGLALAAAAPALLFVLLLVAVSLMRNRLQPWLPLSTGPADPSLRAHLCRWSLALLPLGLSMWAAHLSFHLLTGWNSLAPAIHQALRDLSLLTHAARLPAPPDWAAEHSLLAPNSLLQAQLGLLDVGLLAALYLGWRLVRALPAAPPTGHRHPVQPLTQSLTTLAPWATLVLLLYAAGVWVLLEPMQMRGMMGM